MSSSARCPHCGEPVAPNQRFCGACGEPLPGSGRAARRREPGDARALERSVDDYLKAVSTFERMLHGGAPNSVRLLVARGDALTSLGEYDAAVQAYRDALEIDPRHLEAQLALGRLYNRLARYRDASRVADEVLAHAPSAVDAYLVQARALLATGDFKGIVELAERARREGVSSAALGRVADLAARRYREVLESSAVVQEIFVIHRSTRLIAHRSRLFRPQVDSDLVAGTLHAIQDFIQVALMGPEAGAPGLNELRYGSFIVLVESREHFQVAFVISGTPDTPLRASFARAADEIGRRFGPTLATWDGTLDHVRGVQEFLDKQFFADLQLGELEEELEVG